MRIRSVLRATILVPGILVLTAAGPTSAPEGPGGSAAATSAPAFPDTPLGRAAADYFAAFNSGDDGRMRRFFEDHCSPESLSQRPVAARLEIFHRMKIAERRLRVDRILEASPDRIACLVQNGAKEWRRMEFVADTAAPGKIGGFRIEDADAPSEREAPVRRAATDAEAARRTDEEISAEAAKGDFSGAVLLARGGVAFFRKAWGLADRERRVPNTIDTKFNLGSINKIFTQVAVGQLAAAGKLSLSDTIRKHLPSYPAAYADRVTVGELVSMSSGMGDIFGPKFAEMPKTRLRSLADYLPLFQDEPLRFEPGTRQEYSNAGYVVLGLIIQAASGEDYYRYVREHVFAPAGMGDTGSWAIDDAVPLRAISYTREGGTDPRPATGMHPARGSSAGGGYSTLDDLLKFAVALANGRLLPPEWTAWVFSRADAPTAGAGLPAHGGLGIAGGSPGVNAALDMELDDGVTIVVLANTDPPAAERAARRVRGLLPKP